MTKRSADRSRLSAMKLALAAREAGDRRPFLQAEPIAVIGMGCRFPGDADDPDAYWRLLIDGVDAVSQMPPDRWDMDGYYDPDPDAAGKIYTRHGAFLPRVDEFDADFFAITPREAAGMDPQQRLLLEVAWEALEAAGQAPDGLFGTATGVFVGISTFDYALCRVALASPAGVDAYFSSGSVMSVAAGRLAYTLGLTGPAVAVDTACSSALVAVHLACQSLRRRECRLALAGGVGLLLAPEPYFNFCRARMLSPVGRCRTFDAAADGYVRGEGCGVVVLKRLADALSDGDRVRAVIRGSAVNQDGASGGLTVPSGPSQRQVIEAALKAAMVAPGAMDYLEAHGTGTALGDPIEMGAIGQLFGASPRRTPLLVGSVKTNLGHLEAAAGIAGLIKVILALEKRRIPPHLHFTRPNPRIAWSGLPVVIPTDPTAWPKTSPHPLAGVSAFGFSGTNAHVVVEAAPALPESLPPAEIRPLHLLTLSARTETALERLVRRYRRRLAAPDADDGMANICFSANTGRARFTHRLAVVADSAEALRQALAKGTKDDPARGIFRGTGPRQGALAFLFTGQGAQSVGMGRALYDTAPIFRETIDQCRELLADRLEIPLLDLIYPQSADDTRRAEAFMARTACAQPALFAVEYALAALWKRWGIEPDLLLGHSVGEYVAACLAGVFSLEDGLRLIAARGRLMQALPTGGEMHAVFAGESDLMPLLDDHADVTVAAINGPGLTVVSGAGETLRGICERLAAKGVRTRRLAVSHAFHSPLMAPMLDEFTDIARSVRFSAPNHGLVSNVSGRLAGAEVAHAAYWRRHIMAPVRFADGMQALAAADGRIFLEVGPGPVLIGMGRQCLKDQALTWLPSLRPGQPPWQPMLTSLAVLATQGTAVDWRGFDAAYPRRPVDLPTYPFERRRHWFMPLGQSRPAAPAATGLAGYRLPLPGSTDIRYNLTYRADSPAVVAEHRLFDNRVVAGAAHITLVLQAAIDALGDGSHRLDQLAFHTPLVIPAQGARCVQLIVNPTSDGSGRMPFSMVSAAEADRFASHGWQLHLSGTILADDTEAKKPWPFAEPVSERADDAELSGEAFYEAITAAGHHLGPTFRWIRRIRWMGDRALCHLTAPAAMGHGNSEGLDGPLPGLIDACVQYFCFGGPAQRFTGMAGDLPAKEEIFVPVAMDRFRLHRFPPPAGDLWCHVRFHAADPTGKALSGDVMLLDNSGAAVITMKGLRARALTTALLVGEAKGPALEKAGAKARSQEATVLIGQLQRCAPRKRRALLQHHVTARVTTVTGAAVAAPDPDRGLFDLGIDSLMAMELRNRLADDLGQVLRQTLVFDFPTINAIVDHLAAELELERLPATDDEPAPAALPHPPASPANKETPGAAIAIVGMGCRFPGGAGSPEAFWRTLVEGVDAVTEVPPDRWDIDAYYDPDPDAPGKIVTRFGAFLDGVADFDAAFFGISPREALSLDPQQRLMLEVSWEALEHAGLPPDRLAGTPTGVFIGLSTFDYAALHIADNDPTAIDAYYATGNIPCMAAGRLSYTLGLTGPSLTVDTACSSSLVALHLACQSIRQGECHTALAGGVGLILTPTLSINFSRAHMLAPDGRCKTFDATADGYVRGEGCGMVVLKKLSNALADGDRIWAVVRGSAVNQDGAVAGFTVPSGPAQERVIRAALTFSGISPRQVGYVEAHGTGTALGDPIEVQALGTIFGQRPANDPLVVGSVKTNLGHLEAAAGIAGVIKTVLALNHGLIPPHLHFARPNPKIAWERLPITIPGEARPWPATERVAGVSAFGASGTNAHVVLAAPPASAAPAAGDDTAGGPWLLPLSAKDTTALGELAARYADCLSVRPAPAMADVCYTAVFGRTHLAHRLAVTGQNAAEVAQRLKAFVAGDRTDGVVAGRRPDGPPDAPPSRSTDEATDEGNHITDLAVRYVTGEPLAWRRIRRGRKIALPTYPFQRRRYWPKRFQPGPVKPAMPLDAAALPDHPLLGHAMALAGTDEWRFECLIDRERTGFIYDHVIHEVVVFPLMAGLEMATAAACRVLGTTRLVMKDIDVRRALVLPTTAPWRLQLVLDAPAGQTAERGFRLYGRPTGAQTASWQLCMEGRMRAAGPTDEIVDPTIFEADLPKAADAAACYSRFRSRGIDLGPAFQSLSSVHFGAGEALGQVILPTHLAEQAGAFGLHPVIWDACIQTTGLLLPDTPETYLPVGIARLSINLPRTANQEDAGYACRVRLAPHEEEAVHLSAGFRLIDPASRVLLSAEGVAIHKAPRQAVLRQLDTSGEAAAGKACYRLTWQPHAATGERASAPPGRWLVLGDGSGTGRSLATRLSADGADVVVGDEADSAALESLLAGEMPVRGIACLGGLDLSDDPQQLAGGLMGTVNLVRTLVGHDGSQTPDLWIVTRGGQAVDDHAHAPIPAQAALWGLARVISLEHPELNCRCVDLDPAADPTGGETARLADLLLTPGAETQIALRGGRLHLARLIVDAPASPDNEFTVRGDGSVLITGGLGALGLAAAQWLVDCGARHLTLVGRNAPGPAAQAAVRRLEKKGCTVVCLTADVSVAAAVDRLMDALAERRTPLAGIIHAAGVAADGMLVTQDAQRLGRALAPKAAGAFNLHHRTSHMPLDFFVCFSSMAALLGSPGQSGYAAANAYMDALMHHRRIKGQCGLSVNWGPFGNAGMAARLTDRDQRRLAARGFAFLETADVARMGPLMAAGTVQAAIGPVDWPLYLRAAYRTAPPPLFAELQAAQSPAVPIFTPLTEDARPDSGDLAHALRAAPVDAHRTIIEQALRNGVARVLSLPDADAIAPREPLFDAGFDSLMAEEFRVWLEKRLAVRLRGTLLFDFPTLEALVNHLLNDVLEPPDNPPSAGTDPGDALADLSADEVERLLADELAAIEMEKGN